MLRLCNVTCAPVEHLYNLISLIGNLIIMDPMDPGRLTLPTTSKVPSPRQQKPPRHQTGERFLKGPIPWDWLTRAFRLSGKAPHVALALWFQAGLQQNRTVVLSGASLLELGAKRHAGYRGLAVLEQAGLVTVERHPGRSPRVTIVHPPNAHL